MCEGVHRCAQACVGVFMYMQVCMDMNGCAWEEFSEYILETRVLTSADFNTYPIRIFFYDFCCQKEFRLPGSY